MFICAVKPLTRIGRSVELHCRLNNGSEKALTGYIIARRTETRYWLSLPASLLELGIIA